jgi:small-conductance mechanosensitive channel
MRFCFKFLFLLSLILGTGVLQKPARGGDNSVISKVAQFVPAVGKLQKQLNSIQEQINAISAHKDPSESTDFINARTPVVKVYLSSFTERLERVTTQILDGFSALWAEFSNLKNAHVSWDESSVFLVLLLKFFWVFCLGAFCGYLVWLWLRRRARRHIENLFKASSEKSLLSRIVFWLFAGLEALLPICVMTFVQLGCFFVLKEVHAIQYVFVSLIIAIWFGASFWRLQVLLLRERTHLFFLKHLSPKKRHIVFRQSRFLVFLWLASSWIADVFTVFQLSPVMLRFWGILLGAGMLVSATLILRQVKLPILKFFRRFQGGMTRALLTIWAAFFTLSPALLYLFYLLSDREFERAFYPLVVSLLVIPFVPLLYYLLRRLRVRYLWLNRRRESKGFFHLFIKNRPRAHLLFSILAYLLILFVICKVWQFPFFNYMRDLLGTEVFERTQDTLFFVLGGWFSIHIGDRALTRYLMPRINQVDASQNTYLRARLKTLLSLLRTILRILVLSVLAVVILVRWGQDLTFVLAILGAFSLAVGVAIQSFVKDFFAGLFILMENSLLIGDWVEVDGKIGTVEELSLRTLRLRSDQGTLYTIPFGSITIIGNRSREFTCTVISIPVPYEQEPEKVQGLLERAYQAMRKMAPYRKTCLGSIEIRGLDEVSDYALVFQVRIRTVAGKQEFVRRGYNRFLKKLLDEEGIKIPAPPYPAVRSSTYSLKKK